MHLYCNRIATFAATGVTAATAAATIAAATTTSTTKISLNAKLFIHSFSRTPLH